MHGPSDLIPKRGMLQQPSRWLAQLSIAVGRRGCSCLPGSVQNEQKTPFCTSDPPPHTISPFFTPNENTRHLGWEGDFHLCVCWTISCPGKPISRTLVISLLLPCDQCGSLSNKDGIFARLSVSICSSFSPKLGWAKLLLTELLLCFGFFGN